MNRQEALEVIRKNWPNSQVRLQEALRTIVPEFNESEDEVMKGKLLEILRLCYSGSNCSICTSDYEKLLAWLEKQDMKPTCSKENENIRKEWDADDVWHFNQIIYILKDCNRTELIDWLEKQGEFKTANEVEPKFKVGDWITNDMNTSTFQIVKVEGECYVAADGDKIDWITRSKSYHLWTLKDAKDGDVLASSQIIVLFKQWEDEDTDYNFVIAYAGIDISGKLQITDKHWLISNETKPATKEQCDLLFRKMEEAGYEWDSKKKELKKIEQSNDKLSEEEDARFNTAVQIIADAGYIGTSEWLKSLRSKHKQEWTINDAKPGDILHTSSSASSITFIFKGIRNDEHGSVEGFCCYDSEDGFRGEETYIGWKTDKYRLATPKQCIELGRIMGKKGYIFRFETNQLQKIN